MNFSRTNLTILAATVIATLVVIYYSRQSGDQTIVNVQLPADLSAAAIAGRDIFERQCMACHGKNAGGTKNGPPLVHIIYESGHHGDPLFHRAVRYGVKAHHWPYGNMPKLDGVPSGDVTKILSYVRELQRANGIN